MRKLASIQKIDSISAIEGADRIVCAHVGGWPVVVKAGEFNVGDTIIFCEIDSWIPNTLAPFLTKDGHSPGEYNGIAGERLRTVKLRGQLSQGLVLPINFVTADHEVGDDVSEILGITKWEAPEEISRNTEAKGSFPQFIKKTDQERVQNLRKELTEHVGEEFEVTIKLDGSSCTVYRFNDMLGVCSRNVDLKDIEGNGFWGIAKKLSLLDKLNQFGRNLALQGELIAPNIQSNHENVQKPEWHCFSIWDIDRQEYLLPEDRQAICADLEIPHVPVVDNSFVLNHSCQDLLDMAEGSGMYKGVQREGLVFKSKTSQFSFKAVANSYLLKKK